MSERWAVKSELCKILGVSPPTLANVLEMLPPDARRPVAGSKCGKMEYLEAAVVRVRQQQLADQATAKALRKRAAIEARVATEDDDPLMTGVRSPNLERYRGFRADREKLALERERGSLVPLDSVKTFVSRLAARLRVAGEQLRRLHGEDSQQILSEAIRDIERTEFDG